MRFKSVFMSALTAPRLPLEPIPPDWREEQLLDESAEELFVLYKGEDGTLRIYSGLSGFQIEADEMKEAAN
jgi:hypothetical protein